MKNDKLIAILDHLQMRQVSSEEDRNYFINNTNKALKKTLKKVGAYSVKFAMILATFSVLQKIGIKATFAKATATLVTVMTVATIGAGIVGYQGVKIIIERMQDKEKNKQEFLKPHSQQDYKSFIYLAPSTKVVPKRTTIFKPTIGIMKFKTDLELNPTKLTYQFLKHLPKSKYTFLDMRIYKGGLINHYTECLIYKTKTGFKLTVKGTSVINNEIVHLKDYTFTKLSQLDSVLQQAAKELQNANL